MATLSAVYERTGREVAANAEHALAEAWAKCSTQKELDEHSANTRFLEFLEEHSTLFSGTMESFRIRNFPIDYTPGSLEFGPPPAEVDTSKGRYSIPELRVLYLCDSIEGGLLEIKREENNDRWYQKFVISADSSRLADFSGTPPKDFISQVFWFTELAKDSGGRPASFLFSQLIASLVNSKFDGMVVPGVNGNKQMRYKNVVIFQPSKIWKNWLCPSSHPQNAEQFA